MQAAGSFTDYTSTPAGSNTSAGGSAAEPAYWELSKLKRAVTDYVTNKRDEINEQQDARRYRHGAHWTETQIKALNDRKQPVVTYNRIGRKIDGVVGLVEKLRQDPKAYPRTPKQEQGAELATAVLRYVLDEQDWKAKSPLCAEDGAVDGIGGIEIEIVQGDRGDKEIGFEAFEPESFVYDPHSTRMDFSDARFMGLAKWVDVDTAKEMFPDKAAEIDASLNSGAELTTNSDKEKRWFQSVGNIKQIRLCDLWYKHAGEWCWCIFTGSTKLMEGKSYLIDEKGKTFCKFIAFSANVDHDGDRYGFVRNLKSANDEINQRRSKALHELNSRRVIAEIGAFPDIEKARKEAARPDGVVERNKGFEAEFDDTARLANIEGAFKFLEDAKAEIENFGPNPALIGQGIENKSGRAINLLQQAGIAELGPFILAYRGWKIRVYRAIWNAVQRHWEAERWIRVTDDEGLAQFVGINQLGIDPNTGMPAIVNAVGSLDVDIVIDEGPDQANVMADNFDTLQSLAQSQVPVPPQVLIELSPLQSSVKKRITDMVEQAQQQAAQQPDPEAQARQAELAFKQQDMELSRQKAQDDAQLQAYKVQQEIQLKRETAAADIQLQREKAAADIELQHEQTATQLHLQQQQDHAEGERTDRKFAADSARQRQELEFRVEAKRRESEAAPPAIPSEVIDHLRAVGQSASETQKMLAELAHDLSAPAEFIRGPDGRLGGVRKGKRTITIARDGSGRIAGAK